MSQLFVINKFLRTSKISSFCSISNCSAVKTSYSSPYNNTWDGNAEHFKTVNVCISYKLKSKLVDAQNKEHQALKEYTLASPIKNLLIRSLLSPFLNSTIFGISTNIDERRTSNIVYLNHTSHIKWNWCCFYIFSVSWFFYINNCSSW